MGALDKGRRRRWPWAVALLCVVLLAGVTATLRLALHGHGIRPLITLHAGGDHPDFLASVRFGGHRPPTPELRQLLAAVPRRHTNRLPFADEPVTTGQRAALRRSAVRKRSRATMRRIISELPSRIFTTRVSRQMRSIGRSLE